MLALCMLFLIMIAYKAAHIEKAETVFYEDEWYEYPADELIERYYRESNFVEALAHEDWALWEIRRYGTDAECRLKAIDRKSVV